MAVLLANQNIADAVALAQRVYLVGDGTIQREGSGAWFSQQLDQLIREMPRGSV
jgi:ABC-type branched-subunit amino acid transport system ATPase component